MVEVENFLKKSLFIIDLGRIKTNNKRQMLLKGGGVATPSIPPLDPPLSIRLCGLMTSQFFEN